MWSSVAGSQVSGNSSRLRRRTLPPRWLRMPELGEAAQGGVLGLGEGLGEAVVSLTRAELLVPGDAEARLAVEVAVLLGEHGV